MKILNMSNVSKSLCFALLMLLGVAGERASGLDLVMYGNTAQTSSETVTSFQYAAQSFTTNQLIFRLTGVSVSMNAFRGTNATTVQFSLYDSSSTPNTPGSLVQTLGSVTTPSGVVQDFTFTFTAPSPILLTQDAQYFIVARNLGPDDVKWWSGNQASISTVLNPRPTFYSVISADGTNWGTPSTTRSFNMTVTGVPEPSAYAMAALSFMAFATIGRRKVNGRKQSSI